MLSRGATWFCTALLGLAAASAAAGSFSVSPTRIELPVGQRTAVISLRNTDAAPLTVQASLVDWAQPAGEDVYTPTRAVLATPPVFTVPPNSEQIVRIALRGAHDANRELAYRIFFQEVPAGGAAGSNRLNIALRVGVPIFLLTPKVEERPRLQWSAGRAGDGSLNITAANDGNTHVQVTGFEVSYGDAKGATPVSVVKYVLPGNRISWSVTPPVGADAQQLRIQGHSDRGDFSAEATVVPAR